LVDKELKFIYLTRSRLSFYS